MPLYYFDVKADEVIHRDLIGTDFVNDSAATEGLRSTLLEIAACESCRASEYELMVRRDSELIRTARLTLSEQQSAGQTL